MNDDGRVASKNRVKKESTRRSNSRSYDTPLFRSYIRIENLLFSGVLGVINLLFIENKQAFLLIIGVNEQNKWGRRFNKTVSVAKKYNLESGRRKKERQWGRNLFKLYSAL